MAPTREPGPMPPYDPELAALAGGLDTNPPASAADVPRLREAAAAGRLTDAALARYGVDVRELTTPGPHGVGLLVCRPATPPTPSAPGAVLALHGGAMVLGDRRARDLPLYLRLAVALGLPLVSVDYRLAPEHPYPAALDDCATALSWTAAHLGDLGAAGGRIVVVGGSAGGTLAASLALRTRDRGGPALAGTLLTSPLLDDRERTPSSRQAAALGRGDHAVMRLAWSSLLPPGRADGDRVSAVPARLDDLSGLPPTYLDVGSAETLRDEVVAYAQRLWAAGNDAELHVWPGAFHGSDLVAADAALSSRAYDQRLAWLRRLLA